MKTLYVSDLDSTLLGTDQRTSAFTNERLNILIDNGLCFSYATARSFHTAKTATSGLSASFPVIVYNGTMIKDHQSGKVLWQHRFEKAAAEALIDMLLDSGVSPIVYTFVGGKEQYRYIPHTLHKAAAEFLATRKGDERDYPVATAEELKAGDIFYITCIGDKTRLSPLYNAYRMQHRCLFQDDLYTGEPWLEISPQGAGKAHAAKELQRLLGCERLIVFGDGVNDIDLFAAADEAYAVENADPALKAIATAVIGSNTGDGVAHWLWEHIKGDNHV